MDQDNVKQERKIARCPNCGKSLAVIRGNKITVKKFDYRNPENVAIKVEHDAGGRFTVKCKSCDAASFSTTHKTLSMAYAIRPKEDKNGSVDKSI